MEHKTTMGRMKDIGTVPEPIGTVPSNLLVCEGVEGAGRSVQGAQSDPRHPEGGRYSALQKQSAPSRRVPHVR